MENTERSYIAFISYRHTPLDREAAERVQKKIENYIVPKDFREQFDGKKLGVCFRDEDELPASSSLTDSIYYALDHSQFLIVICSPDLPLSKWCEAEIKYFLKTHDRDHILAVLADGDPEVSFSPYMLHDFDEDGNILRDWEPLAANIAGENHTINKKTFKKEVTRLCAAMIGCPFDMLWQRERRARTNRLLAAAGAAVAVLAIFLGVVLNRNAQIAAQNEQIKAANDQITAQNDELTEKNDEIQKQNDQITEQNEKIEDQNTQLQSQLSTVLVDSGITKLQNYDINGALEDALAALESDDPGIYDHRAEKLLADALGTYKTGQLQSKLVYEQYTNILQIQVTDDNKYALLLDHVGAVRCLDLNDYSVKWEYLSKDLDLKIYTRNLEDRLLLKTAGQLLCLDLADGSLLWSYDQDSANYFQCISDDAALFAVLDTKAGEEGIALSTDTQQFPDTGYFRPVYAVLLDTKTGKETGRIELPSDDSFGFYKLTEDFLDKNFATDFSDNNSKFVCVLPFRTKDESDTLVQETLFAIDVKENRLLSSPVAVSTTGFDRIPFDIFFGAVINNTAGTIYLAQNHAIDEEVLVQTFYAQENDYRQESVNRNMYFGSDTISLYDVTDSINRTVPLLANDRHMVLFTDKDILICDNVKGEIGRGYKTDTNIISAEWLDTKKEVCQIVTEGGSVLRLDLSTDEGYILDSLDQFYLDQKSILCHSSVNGGIVANKNDGSCLLVQNSAQNQLIRLQYQTDPGASVLQKSSDDLLIDNSETLIGFLPDSDIGMLFLNGKTVFTFDRKNGEILQSAKMKESFSHGIRDVFLLDESHFVQGNKLYSTEDGSVTAYLEESPNTTDFYDADLYLNSRMKNNDLITTGIHYAPIPDENSELGYATIAVYEAWINQTYSIIFLIADVTNDSIPLAEVGENGVILICGDDWADEKDSVVFLLYDLATQDWVYTFENTYPDLQHLKAVGTKLPLAAVLYENGEMKLLFYQDGTTKAYTIYDDTLGKYTALNEALAIGFSEGDQYLLMLSSAGRLCITDVDRLLKDASSNANNSANYDRFNGIVDIFHDNLQTYDNFIKADLSADEKTLYISAGYKAHFCNAIFMDTDSWEVKAEVPDFYKVDEENNKIYAFTDNADGNGSSAIVTYPVYTLEELKAWAQEELEK